MCALRRVGTRRYLGRAMTTMDAALEGQRAGWGRNFLARPVPLALMFGSFFFLTLPLVFAEERSLFDGWLISPLAVYASLLGMSHFLVTFPEYFKRNNLRHFSSAPHYALLYFGVPVLIVAYVAIVYGMRGHERGAGTLSLMAFWMFMFIRGIDKYHVLRQSFGVFEMMKTQVNLRYVMWSKNLARAFFMSMFLVQFHTASNARVFEATPLSVGLSIAAGVFFIALMGVLVHRASTVPREDRAYALIPIAYLIVQGICATLVAYKTIFYIASLALHYVEYHLLMRPRVFSNLDEGSAVDKPLLWLKKRQWVFWVGLIATSLFVGLGPTIANDFEHPLGGSGWVFWLFVVQTNVALLHFYVDALLWRFKHPYFRKTLLPLYVDKRA